MILIKETKTTGRTNLMNRRDTKMDGNIIFIIKVVEKKKFEANYIDFFLCVCVLFRCWGTDNGYYRFRSNYLYLN